MRARSFLAFLGAALLAGAIPLPARADPCGMVPPIWIGKGVAISRIGVQKTYVFHKDGVETFVIRSGFEGKVDNFGMLIPFPNPPAIRKVPDDIFAHVAAAIDPPEVVIDTRLRGLGRFSSGLEEKALRFAAREQMPDAEEVVVLNQEAVGMYEVAVLAAGSARALKRWMDDHGYRYPEGMDGVCEEYVQERWCFVAVKTRVGQKAGTDPKPGMREVDSKLPEGSTFDGHVQAMGFRFRSEELVVPMRLSAFNEGDLRNVVYVLADGPVKVRDIPEKYVVRQVPGKDLIRNLTQPLPLRVIGGDRDDIPDWYGQSLPTMRDPKPRSGHARELFAGDLLAASTGELAHPHEEEEKVLLRISERLGLRGPEIDALHAAALEKLRDEVLKGALAKLEGMTLTVVDGDFPREVIARDNLAFAGFEMDAARNEAASYDAKLLGPAPELEGKVYLGMVEPGDDAVEVLLAKATSRRTLGVAVGLGLLGLLVGLGGRGGRRYRSGRHGRTPRLRPGRNGTGGRWPVALLALVIGLPLLAGGAFAQDRDEPTLVELIQRLDHPDEADAAVAALIRRGEEAIPVLRDEAFRGGSVARRGWAIVCLASIGGEGVETSLGTLLGDGQQSALVRTWAAAGLVSLAPDTSRLAGLANHVWTYPALARPLEKRLVALLADAEGEVTIPQLIDLSIRIPALQQTIAKRILVHDPEVLTDALLDLMLTSTDQNLRRVAAAYLATVAQEGNEEIAAKVAAAFRFDADAKDIPWAGGPLFLPALQWSREEARALVGNLLRWHLWLDRHGRQAEQRPIHNNLIHWQLAQIAGYHSPGWNETSTEQWLVRWARVVGLAGIEEILAEQGVLEDEKYKRVLTGF